MRIQIDDLSLIDLYTLDDDALTIQINLAKIIKSEPRASSQNRFTQSL